MSVCLNYVYAPHECSACSGQKRVSNPLKQELQKAVNPGPLQGGQKI